MKVLIRESDSEAQWTYDNLNVVDPDPDFDGYDEFGNEVDTGMDFSRAGKEILDTLIAELGMADDAEGDTDDILFHWRCERGALTLGDNGSAPHIRVWQDDGQRRSFPATPEGARAAAAAAGPRQGRGR